MPDDVPRSLTARLGRAFAVHPHGPTPVAAAVAADLAARARRRARGLAWAGLLVNLPLFYLDDWLNYVRGHMADPTDGYHEVGLFVWRLAAVGTLAAYLAAERRAPRDAASDRRWASGLAVWFTLLGGWFGAYFESNAPSYALFGLTLLLVAVLIHSPSRAAAAAYGAATVVALAGARLLGVTDAVVLDWTPVFALMSGFALFVDRALYLQAYRNVESAHLIGRANSDLAATLAELRETQTRLVEAERQAERARIGRDLHDSVGAQLSSLLAGVELMRLGRRAGTGPAVSLDEVEADAREAMAQLREAVWALSTAQITVEGVAAQLRRFADGRALRSGMEAVVRAEGARDAVLPPPLALHLYRIGQEAVQNAVKHSGGRTVTICVAATDATVRLLVSDDGAFRPPVAGDGAPSGFGMRTMRERAEAMGGALVVETALGTAVEVTAPLDAPPDDASAAAETGAAEVSQPYG